MEIFAGEEDPVDFCGVVDVLCPFLETTDVFGEYRAIEVGDDVPAFGSTDLNFVFVGCI